LFDLESSEDGTVNLRRLKPEEADYIKLWPKVGFFARSHTTNFNRSSEKSSLKSFKIDGKWGASD
jgi:hypothetical protein